MSRKKHGLTAVGNALLDILSFADEDFVTDQARFGMQKGTMNLIDSQRANELYKHIGAAKEMSGGSAANSLAGFVSFGGKGAFIGKVSDDQFGDIFRHDMTSQGIHFSTPSYKGGDEETGRSYVLVTPDGERTMNTYLGASSKINSEDVDTALITGSKIVLLEGYFFDQPNAKKAFFKAARVVNRSEGTHLALTLSDHACVKRHHKDFMNLVKGHVDILIANEKEIKALTMKDDFREAADIARSYCDIAVLTQGSKGAVIINGDDWHDIGTVKPEKLVDTTGAGDAFAAGVLYGLSEGFNLQTCGELGAKAASKTISHMGARSVGVRFSDFLIK